MSRQSEGRHPGARRNPEARSLERRDAVTAHPDRIPACAGMTPPGMGLVGVRGGVASQALDSSLRGVTAPGRRCRDGANNFEAPALRPRHAVVALPTQRAFARWARTAVRCLQPDPRAGRYPRHRSPAIADPVRTSGPAGSARAGPRQEVRAMPGSAVSATRRRLVSAPGRGSGRWPPWLSDWSRPRSASLPRAPVWRRSPCAVGAPVRGRATRPPLPTASGARWTGRRAGPADPEHTDR